MRRILIILFCLFPFATHAEDIVLGMSQDEVAITATFDGSNILLFGAIKREAPIPEGNLGIIVTISGPSSPVSVRRKERKFGIWVNTDTVDVDLAPSFYAIATNAPFEKVVKSTEDLRHKISIERAIRSVGAPMQVADSQAFSEALIRIRKKEKLYQLLENQVSVDQETLFRTSINLPANLTEGDYFTRIFLTRDGNIISKFQTTIDVKKVGIERFLFNLSRQQPLAYGLLSLAIAIVSGWLASSFFRILRSR